MLRRMGRYDKAAADYGRALQIVRNGPERRYLTRRLRETSEISETSETSETRPAG